MAPLYQHFNKQKVSPPPATILLGNYSAVSTTNVNYSFTQVNSSLLLDNTGDVNTSATNPVYTNNICFANTTVGYSTGQTIIAKMKFNAIGTGEQVGLGLRVSGTGHRFLILASPGSPIGGFRRCSFLSNNSFFSGYGDAVFTHSVGTSFWVSIRDDGTNIIFGHSSDGTNFTTLSVNKAANSVNWSPNQFCLLMVPRYNSTTGVRTSVTYETISVA